MSHDPKPDRLLLTGVPRVEFYSGGPRCPEDLTFEACLRAVLEYLGECPGCRHVAAHQVGSPVSCVYAWLLGMTGHAFSTIWEPGWSEGNANLHWIADDPTEPYLRGLEAIGRRGEVLIRGHLWPDEETIKARILASLSAGVPAVALGVAGPPEAGLVTGFDEGGAVLMGWSFFQGMPEFRASLSFEPTGEYRVRDWYAGMEGLIMLDEKVPQPSRGESVRGSLRFGLERIRTSWIAGRHAGLAAYDAWAEHLLREDEFAAGDQAGLWQRFSCHDNMVGNVAEQRWYGSLYLSEVASDEDRMAPQLLRAAACMAEEHRLMWDVWGLVGGIGRDPAKMQKLAEPGVRRAVADLVLASRGRCAQAADHLEEALAQG
jgi:hypothetical protein